MTELEEAQRETIEALRAQVADLKQWLAECKTKCRAYLDARERVISLGEKQCQAMLKAQCAAQLSDEEFARFVFEHFGGYWLRGTACERGMRALPERIELRVTEMARELELKRGGP